MRRALVIIALFGCKKQQDEPAPKPVDKPAVAGDAAASGACDHVELELASTILSDAAHPCRKRLDASYGRMVATGLAFSGTVVSTAPSRGAGLFITCQHCTGADGDGIRDPEIAEPSAFQTRAPASLANGKVHSGRESQIYFVHRLFSHMPPRSAFDDRHRLVHVHPLHDFVVGTLNGDPIEVVGHLGVMPPAKVGDTKLALHDPREIARSATPWADAKPGSHALVLGFPRDLPDRAFGGELVASVGEILDDARAKDLLLRSDADEAAIPYNPEVELIVAARAVSGMSGGAAFDDEGKYLGVSVRGTLKPVDGKYLVRVVRAPYVMKQFATALAAAPPALRDKVTPFASR